LPGVLDHLADGGWIGIHGEGVSVGTTFS
jgi:hypothetical protein